MGKSSTGGRSKDFSTEAVSEELLSVLFHELRNPLSAMKMVLSALQQEIAGPLNENQKELMDIAVRKADTLLELTLDFSDLIDMERGRLNLEMGECDLVELAERASEKAREEVGKGNLEIRLRSDLNEAKVICDSGRVSRAIKKLICNAADFTNEKITVSVERRDGCFVICVENTGSGFVSEEVEAAIKSGLGSWDWKHTEREKLILGLMFSSGAIKAHGGTIEAQNVRGKGSRLCFTLPTS